MSDSAAPPDSTTAAAPSDAPEQSPSDSASAPKPSKRFSFQGAKDALSGLKAKLQPPISHRDNLQKGLEHVVSKSQGSSVDEGSMSLESTSLIGVIEKDTIDKVLAAEHVGNFVQIRGTDDKIWEKMPLYARLGMHLLFYGNEQIRFLNLKKIKNVLREQTLKEGKIYDNDDPKVVVPHIQSFIKTYAIDTNELLEPDIKAYKTFNAFFSRKLKPDARPVSSPDDPTVITSAADSRLTVWSSIKEAKDIWVKGKNFTLAELFDDAELAKKFGNQPELAIFRLAPQDYHRFHAPYDATLGPVKHIQGDYFTVNPQAVNEALDVFTGNTRSVLQLEAKLSAGSETTPVVLVAVGALLVGSIGWSKTTGDTIKKGEDLGYFAYGGSTVITVYPEGSVKWDTDLAETSGKKLETLVKVGEKIGTAVPNPKPAA